MTKHFGEFLNIIDHSIVKNKKKRMYPTTASFEITRRCNLDCIHCYNRGIASTYRIENELTTKQVFQVIDGLCDLGILILTVTGGEPFLRKDILNILNYIKNNTQITLIIQTNGTLINKNVSEYLSKILTENDIIQVSLDGPRDIHNKIRGTECWSRVMESLKLLSENNLSTEVNITPTTLNEDHIIPLLYQLEGIKKFGASPMAVFNENDKKYVPDIKKLLNTEKEVINILQSKGIEYTLGIGGEFCQYHSFKTEELTYLKNSKSSIKILNEGVQCNAGITKFHITYDGRVFPCVFLQFDNFLMGNILQKSLKNIWAEWNINKTIRDLNNTKCASCDFLHVCKGGCVGMAYSYYKDINKPDPRCL